MNIDLVVPFFSARITANLAGYGSVMDLAHRLWQYQVCTLNFREDSHASVRVTHEALEKPMNQTTVPQSDTAAVVKAMRQFNMARVEQLDRNKLQEFPEAASPGDYIRQGDLYIFKLDAIPANAERVAPQAQLAIGDTQGARHMLNGPTEQYMLPNATEYEGRIVKVDTPVVLEHPEHGHWRLTTGLYSVVFQRNLDADERAVRAKD